MRAMKDSGVEWIGEIPQEWTIVRTKYIASITNGCDPKTEGNVPVYGSGDGSFKSCGEYKEGPAVLLGRKGATLHIPHYVNGKYWNVDTAFDVKMVSDRFELKYYYALSMCFDYKYYTSTTTLPSMTQTNYGNMYLPFPSRAEQSRIIAFIETKCAKIDALIAAKEKTNALLKERRQSIIYEAVTKGLDPTVPMKDSGVEWIGEIPGTWSTRKTKYIGTFKSGDGITSESISDDDKYPVYGGNGIRGYTDRFTHEGSYILIGRQGALCGNVHLVRGSFWASEHAVVGDIVPDFEIRLAFYILTAFNLNRLSVTAAQPGLSVDQIINVIVPMPGSAEEQKEICDYLDINCTEADSVIELNERTIRQLKEYRQSLIYEAVTGKIEV